MAKKLSVAQVESYRRDGFLGSISVLNAAEITRFRAELEAFEAETGKPLDFPERSKSYLLFEWADRIVHHPEVLDAVEDVIGPDILVYHTTMNIKEARNEAYIPWHQDDDYFHLDPPEHLTAWVALSDASETAGCMRMIPGSRAEGLVPHAEKPEKDHLIRLGKAIHDRFDDSDGVAVPLRAGEMSLHNTHTIHSSGPNRSDDRRIGYAVSFIPAHVRPQTEPRTSVLCVRGADRYGHFVHEERLKTPLSNAARAAHTEAYRRYTAATGIAT